uniref:F-box domain-containing protein n=1 Tax=Ditylenchus dipsaci TaxID=166011 RepID=A0A915CZA9_9BILA
MNLINKIPDDILLEVFRKLPTVADLLKCVRVCKRWNKVVQSYGFLHFKTLSKATIFPALWQESRKRMSLNEGISMLKKCIKCVTHIDFEEVIFNYGVLSGEYVAIQHMNKEIWKYYYCMEQD